MVFNEWKTVRFHFSKRRWVFLKPTLKQTDYILISSWLKQCRASSPVALLATCHLRHPAQGRGTLCAGPLKQQPVNNLVNK